MQDESALTTTAPDPEEKFPPKPGGMVDSHRRTMAARQAQAEAASLPEDEVPGGYEAVRVDVQVSDTYGAATYGIGTNLNPTLRILGSDAKRKRAVVMIGQL